jgi:hypothetical protein
VTALHTRIADTLGWSTTDVQSFSLRALRELVRHVDSALAGEITAAIVQQRKVL